LQLSLKPLKGAGDEPGGGAVETDLPLNLVACPGTTLFPFTGIPWPIAMAGGDLGSVGGKSKGFKEGGRALFVVIRFAVGAEPLGRSGMEGDL